MGLRDTFNRLFPSGPKAYALGESPGVSKGLHLVLCNDAGGFDIFTDIIQDRLRAQGHEITIHVVSNRRQLIRYLNKLSREGKPVPNAFFLDVYGTGIGVPKMVGPEVAGEVADWYEKNYPGVALPEVNFLSQELDLAALAAADLMQKDPRFPVASFVDKREVDWLCDMLDGNLEDNNRMPSTPTMRELVSRKLDIELDMDHAGYNYRRLLETLETVSGNNALAAWRRGMVRPEVAIKQLRGYADGVMAALKSGLYSDAKLKEAGIVPAAKFYGEAGFPVKGNVVFSIKDVESAWTTGRPVLVMRSYDPEVVPLLASGKLGGLVVTSTYMASHLKLLCETHMVCGLFGEIPPGVKRPKREFNEESKPNLPSFFENDEAVIGGRKIKKGQSVLVGIDTGISFDPPETLSLPSLTPEAIGNDPQLHHDVHALGELGECFREFFGKAGISAPGVKANIESSSSAVLNAVGSIGLIRTEQMVAAHPEQLSALKAAILHHQDKAYDELFNVAKYEYADIFRKLNDDAAVKVRLFDFVHQEVLTRDEQKRFLELYPKLDMHGGEALAAWPKLYEGQVRAIFAALKDAAPDAATPLEIMMPAIRTEADVTAVKALVANVAMEMGVKASQYSFGVMTETLEACRNIEAIARHCDFISFGTNDLTSQHFNMARSDLKAHAHYAEQHGFDPFKTLAPEIFSMMEETIATGRRVKPGLRVDVCGAQAADAETAVRLHKIGVDNVSVAPSLANLYALPLQVAYKVFDERGQAPKPGPAQTL